jgi:threonine/homoserine/homoserine lactone efflux protein
VETDWGFALAEALPLAVAIAASPFAIVPAILLLFTERPKATGGAFLGGWVLGLTVVTVAATMLASVLDVLDGTPAWLSWLRIAVGALLVALALRKVLKRSTVTTPPAWMSTVEQATPSRAFVLAVVMAVANPKILLLAAAAGVIIGAADLPRSETAALVVAVIVVAALSVALPVVLYLVFGAQVLKPLSAARDWLIRHNAVVMAIVLTVLGLALITDGISTLR